MSQSKQSATRMIDVSQKPPVIREALAQGRILMSTETLNMVRGGLIPKGNVLEVARVAAIMAVKNTPQSIPLCHPVRVDKAQVDFSFDENDCAVNIQVFVKGVDRTGLEMEALHAVSVAALSIYDMCKIVDKGMVISDVRLLKKTKGSNEQESCVA